MGSKNKITFDINWLRRHKEHAYIPYNSITPFQDLQDFVKMSFKVTRDLYFTETTLLSTDSLKERKNTHIFMASNIEF